MDIPRDKPNRHRVRIGIAAVAITALLVVSLALSRWEPAAPSVDRAGIWVDTVRQGTMVRQVRGPGTLLPEQIRYISALSPGRVERILIVPGAEVTPETPLFVLSNPDVHLQAMEAQRQLATARANLVSLQATLENNQLTQESTLGSARAEYREAVRQVEAERSLAERGLIPVLDIRRREDQVAQFAERLQLEEKRLEFLGASTAAQLSAARSEIERLEALAELQQSYLESLTVRAGAPGVLRELSLAAGEALQEGQYVTPGTRVAVVVQPGRLKAELRIPEMQIRDVAVGQTAEIDTRNGLVPGRVVRIDPAVLNGTVTVDIALEGELPRGARPDLSIDGRIEIERLENAVHVGRPTNGQAESTVGIYRIEPDGRFARRTSVSLGGTSYNAVEIRNGLVPGDVIILSDMSQWSAFDRVRLR